jgi:hypothetical protein
MNLFIMCGPLVIYDSNVASSSHGPFASSLSLFSPCNIDLSNDLNHEDLMNDDVPILEKHLPIV